MIAEVTAWNFFAGGIAGVGVLIFLCLASFTFLNYFNRDDD